MYIYTQLLKVVAEQEQEVVSLKVLLEQWQPTQVWFMFHRPVIFVSAELLLWPGWWHSREEQWQLHCVPWRELTPKLPLNLVLCGVILCWPSRGWHRILTLTLCLPQNCVLCGFEARSRSRLLEGGLSFTCIKGSFTSIEIRPEQSVFHLQVSPAFTEQHIRQSKVSPKRAVAKADEVCRLNPKKFCAAYRETGRVTNRESWKCSKFTVSSWAKRLVLV